MRSARHHAAGRRRFRADGGHALEKGHPNRRHQGRMTRLGTSIGSLMSKVRRIFALVLYCVGLWAVFDLLYSQFVYVADPPVRTANARYDHGLLPNVATYETWGTRRYRFYTNNLGFRDAAVREVPLQSA